MTCASCAHRIERKLNKLDGVDASVNYATERAHVRYPAGVATEDLIETVDAAGYDADAPARRGPSDESARPRRLRLGSSRPCSARPGRAAGDGARPCGSPAGSGGRSLLSAPVVVVGRLAVPPGRRPNARHGASTMDTLVSRLAAYGWSASR